jgi:hypothetical protein
VQQAWTAFQGNMAAASPASPSLAPQDASPAAAAPQPAAARPEAPGGSFEC